jgi:hypothetical protein
MPDWHDTSSIPFQLGRSLAVHLFPTCQIGRGLDVFVIAVRMFRTFFLWDFQRRLLGGSLLVFNID